jgi:hypothetical protein
MASGSTGGGSVDPDKLTLVNIRDGHVKYKNLKKDKLKLLGATFFNHIEDLELRLKKTKSPQHLHPQQDLQAPGKAQGVEGRRLCQREWHQRHGGQA